MSSTKKEETAPKLQEFHEHFDVVFVDATGYCNLAASVNRLTYLRVSEHSGLVIDSLDHWACHKWPILIIDKSISSSHACIHI